MLADPVSAILNGTGMLVRPAPEPLRVHLGCFWALTAEHAATVETLPDACCQFTAELSESAPAAMFLSGPRSRPQRYHKLMRTRVVGVRLRPGVGYLLFRRPICGLVDRRVNFPAPGLALEMEASSIAGCFDALERCLARLLCDRAIDPPVAAAIRTIAESAGGARIAEVARACGIGRRHLERLMRVWVGMSPKRLARIARFQALLGNVADGGARHWTSIAAQSYTDQAHLIHEFSEFAGVSPRRFYAAQNAHTATARCA